jgi:hypothetical protein
MQRTTDRPAHNGPGENTDDERNLNEAHPGGHECYISDPQLVRTRCRKFPVNQIEGAHQCIIHDRRPALGASPHAFYLQSSHQALYRAPHDFDTLSVKLAPNLTGSVYPKVLSPDPRDITLQRFVTLGAFWPPVRIILTGFVLVIRRPGDRQWLADRLDPVCVLMLANKAASISVGGRAPPGRKKPTPCAGSHWHVLTRDSHA